MDKKYNHLQVEKDKNNKWVKQKYFATHDLSKPPFTIILPPPNVTGKLHIGHAWNGYIQDTIIRYKKIKGFDVMWVPGMDHAGISTQAKVIEHLKASNIDFSKLSRQAFLKHAWSWKEQYSAVIRDQWGKLGLALDYPNERFTLDESANEAVNKVFIELYNQGLIYKDTKAINWDPLQKTALSNMEVIAKATNQKMYYIKYYLENKTTFLTISTTRLETLFSDVAVAVHPQDSRYQDLIGQNIIHPLTQKTLPIIADPYIDSNFGSGVMKVSAHAINDIVIIKEHNLEIIETIDKDGKLNHLTGNFKGMDRFEAREKIAEFLAANSFLVKIEDVISNVGYSERSGAAVEILVSPQWFVKMDILAQKVLDNLQTSEGVKFYPGRFTKVVERWMLEIHDWTVSRQLVWGHRIPAWYRGQEIKVQLASPGNDWVQDEDVLDTWFSSALSPFVFLDWPQSNSKIKRYYPTSLLVTGWDIIFFWVARMYFQGLHFMDGQIPFQEVLLHGLIRDEEGRKMSKSLNNGIDPMEVIDQYGSDALRAFLLWNSSPGQDIRYSKQKIEAAWNMNNKLWNISRYISQMPNTNQVATDIDYWIYQKLVALSDRIDKYLLKYDFTLVGKDVQKFIYEDFSSWYIELAKSNVSKQSAQLALEYLLILLHPFIPFLTDHLYQLIFKKELLASNFPKLPLQKNVAYVDDIIEITSTLRKFREEHQISKKTPIYYWLNPLPKNEQILLTINSLVNGVIRQNQDSFIKIKNFELNIEISSSLKANEASRIAKEIAFLKTEITRAEQLLSNQGFVSKAPASKIAAEKEKLAEFRLKLGNYLEKQK